MYTTSNICHRPRVYKFHLFSSPHALNFISWPKAGRNLLLSLFIYQIPALMFGPFGLCCNVVLFFGLCLLHSTTTYKKKVTSVAFTFFFSVSLQCFCNELMCPFYHLATNYVYEMKVRESTSHCYLSICIFSCWKHELWFRGAGGALKC